MSTDGSRRNVLFTTGIRSEYDILHAVMQSVEVNPALHAQVIITGAHWAPMYGLTAQEVQRDGFECVGRIESLLNSDSGAGRAKSAAIQLAGLVDAISLNRPSFLVAMGDREEALTVAMTGAYMSLPVVHIGGGDTADDGNVDNAVRHATTKLSHLHMVTTTGSAKRVTQMGEEEWRVHVVGAPGLDRFHAVPQMTDAELDQALGRSVRRPFVMVVQHSIIDQVDTAGAQMRETLSAVVESGFPAFISYPNSDAGSQRIIAVIEEFTAKHPEQLCAYQNLPREVFVNLLRRARVLVGNSSAGIIEAPLLGLPVVNVGSRQVGREHGANVTFVEPSQPVIAAAIRRAAEDESYRAVVADGGNPYGDGRAGARIADILASIEIDDRLIYKRNAY